MVWSPPCNHGPPCIRGEDQRASGRLKRDSDLGERSMKSLCITLSLFYKGPAIRDKSLDWSNFQKMQGTSLVTMPKFKGRWDEFTVLLAMKVPQKSQ